MSAKPKKLNSGPLSPPPRPDTSTRANPPSSTAPNRKLLPAKPRTRSRSANSRPPNQPKPSPPTRSKSRGRALGDKTKALPPPSKSSKPNKPSKPPPINNGNSSPPTFANHHSSPYKNDNNNSAMSKIGGKNNQNTYFDKQLPPSRLRAKTAAPQSPPSVAVRAPKKMHELPSIGFGGLAGNSTAIDHTPSLRPRNLGQNKKPKAPPTKNKNDSSNSKSKPKKPRKRGSKIQKKPLPPNSKKSTKNVILPTQIEEEKETETELIINPIMPDDQNCLSNKNSPTQSPRKRGGHNRDYSIVKSVPLIFKTVSYESNPSASPKRKPGPNGTMHSPRNTRQFGLLSPSGRHKGFATFEDQREGLIKASCQCKQIEYELLTTPQEIQHCYCTMCRKMHGSSCATWTPFLESDIRWIKKGKQTVYQSSDKVTRSFCSTCGSNISLKYAFQPDTIWLTPALFDGVTKKNQNNSDVKTWWLNIRILHIFCASKCEWYDIPNDGHPQLSEADIQNSEVNGEPRFVYNKKLPPKPSGH